MAIYLKDYISTPGSSVTGTGTVTGPSDEYAYHAMRIGNQEKQLQFQLTMSIRL